MSDALAVDTGKRGEPREREPRARAASASRARARTSREREPRAPRALSREKREASPEPRAASRKKRARTASRKKRAASRRKPRAAASREPARPQAREPRAAVRAAAFPFLRTIEEFDFTYQSTLRLTTIGSLLTPDFVTEGHSVILEGKPGRGKTHLAIAIAYRELQNGFDALFVTAASSSTNSLPRAATVACVRHLQFT